MKVTRAIAMPKDEGYVIELCNRILRSTAKRQHRFEWLIGDPGKKGRCAKLPVDAYYEELKLVVEYRERQHSEPVPFMDRKDTVSGCKRGEQRRRYDQRRREKIPENGLALVELDCTMFDLNAQKRLLRTAKDVEVVQLALAPFLPKED